MSESGFDHLWEGSRPDEHAKALMRPVALGFELLGEVFHLVSEHALLGEVVPFVGVRAKGYGQQRHTRFFRRLAILEPVTALACGDHVLPFVVATPRDGQDVIAS